MMAASQPKPSLLNPVTGLTLRVLLGREMDVSYFHCGIFHHLASTNFKRRRIDSVI